MKRRLLSVFLIVMMSVSCLAQNALAIGANVPDSEEFKFERNLATIFEALNSQEFTLTALGEYRYEIPLEDGSISVVTIRNEQDPVGRTKGDGDKTYDVVAGQSYTNTTTINDIYNSDGDIVFTVHYKVTDAGYANDTYKIVATDVTITADPPYGYKVSESSTGHTSEADGTVVFGASGRVLFKRIFYSDVLFNIFFNANSLNNKRVRITYNYTCGTV